VKPSQFRENFSSIVVTAILALFFVTFTAQAFEIPSPSMEYTLMIGDRPFVNRVSFAPPTKWLGPLIPYEEIRRGDIIIFNHPAQADRKHMVKRAIGLPGDRLRIVNRQVFINGHPLDEGYKVHKEVMADPYGANFPSLPPPSAGIPAEWAKWRDELPKHIDKDGWLVIPPGNYFGMGDNRDNSWDSRYWGFIPRENILGRPLGLVWSLNFTAEDYQKMSALERFTKLVGDPRHRTRWSRLFLTFPRANP
jgi:signal peptidase I